MKRLLDLNRLLEAKTHFLFGPRACGKSYLIDQQLAGKAKILSLLDSDLYLALQARPSALREMIASNTDPIVVIDEIQRIPELLDEVHLHLQKKGKERFLLTGSSARKLRRNNANMLAGRARRAELFPFCVRELKNNGIFELERILTFGGLPLVYLGKEPYSELRDYLDTYLNEEIKVEANVRNLPNFSRFLRVASLSNGELINFANLASDAQIHANTVREYFEILKDTLLAFTLEPWQLSKKRKAIQTAKFYFFDNGIANALNQIKGINPGTNLYGRAFEQLIALELRAFRSYFRKDDEICFWRTHQKTEVDFIIGDHTAIEVKSANRVSARDHKGLLKLKEEGITKHHYVVSLDPIPQKFESGIEHLPFDTFIEKLWSGDLF